MKNKYQRILNNKKKKQKTKRTVAIEQKKSVTFQIQSI